jgi:hypothetical protein
VYEDATFYAIDTAFTEDLIERYRARLKNPRIQTFRSLDAIAPPIERQASLILLMDVIEHVEDEIAFVRELRGRPSVGADTRFLVTVPAYQSLFSSHDAFLGHYRRYSNRTLRESLEKAGLRVLDIGYFFSSLLPIRWVQLIKERALGVEPGAETGLVKWQGSNAAAELLRRALVADARISMFFNAAGLRLPGLSNYAICVKSA